MKTFIMVDVEADGPIPGDYSMISLGAVVVEPGLKRTFEAKFRPISEHYKPDALAGHSREETLEFPEPIEGIKAFAEWLAQFERPMFIADNNGFDWQFVNWYFHHFYGRNPFGYSSTNLGSLYKGFVRDFRKSFKHLRRTRHDHNPVNDAKGNAEALLKMFDMGFRT